MSFCMTGLTKNVLRSLPKLDLDEYVIETGFSTEMGMGHFW